MLCISKTDSYSSWRFRFPHLFIVSRNALAFLCLTVGSVVALATPVDVSADTLLSNVSDPAVGYTDMRGTNQPTDNYGEHPASIRVLSTWDIERVRSVGYAICQTLTPPSVNRDVFVYHLDSSRNKVATSSMVNMADLPYCSSYSTTTPPSLTYFTFPSSFTLDEGESLVLATEIMNSATGIRVFYANTSPVGVVEDYWCYSSNNSNFTCTTSFSIPIFEISNTIQSVTGTGFNSVMNTRFTDLDITGTSTLNIDVDYFLDGDEIDTTVSAKNPTWVKFWYADRASTSTDFEKINEVISVVAGSSTVDTNITGLADGTYDLLIGFSNFGCSAGLSDCPFPDSYVYSSFTIGGGVLTATGTNEFYDRTSPIQDNTYQECGITNIGGCLINAGLYLFVPDDDSIQQISDSFEGLQTTFPFVYAFQANDYIDTLFSATSTDAGIVASTTLGTITFVNRAMLEAVPYSDTFRTIIAYSMWLTFLWGAYRVVLKMFNPTTV